MNNTPLPRNLSTTLPNYTIDQLTTAYAVAMDRARQARPGTVACTRAVNLAHLISGHIFDRGFRLVRCHDGAYSFERIGGAR